jgi:hypothetical protein
VEHHHWFESCLADAEFGKKPADGWHRLGGLDQVFAAKQTIKIFHLIKEVINAFKN